MVGIIVIDRSGGPLLPGAIIARNLTREVEFFYPFTMVLAERSWVRAPWEAAVVGCWILLMIVFPLCNRERLRVGDLIGGTIVIAMPKRVLREDLAEESRRFVFSQNYLQHYGIIELQVLEDVLRRPAVAETYQLEREICARIARRIGWAGKILPEDTSVFLRDFYSAQRAFLEKLKTLGEERADKTYQGREAG
jgi:hypothetical protein